MPAHGVRPELLVARADEALALALRVDDNSFEMAGPTAHNDDAERRVA